MSIWPKKKPKGGKVGAGTIEPDLDLNDLDHIDEAAQEIGLVLHTSKGRPFRLEIMDDLFDAVESASSAETHQHRRHHIRRAAKIIKENDREFGEK